MKTILIFGLLGMGLASAGEKSGHAELELLLGSKAYSPGTVVEAGIRLKIEEGWHSYWVNPGEGGMAPRVEWDLPEGWVAGPVLYPVPKRFMTGVLPGYGYEDEVVLPVFLTPGENSSGSAKVGVKVSWLTCNDDACVPGSATVTRELEAGVGDPTADATRIGEALKKVPQPLAGAGLEVEALEKAVRLEVTLPDAVDPGGAEVFPATPGALDHGRKIKLTKAEGAWVAEVPLNEYADGPPQELEIVLAGGALKEPLLLKWPAAGPAEVVE